MSCICLLLCAAWIAGMPRGTLLTPQPRRPSLAAPACDVRHNCERCFAAAHQLPRNMAPDEKVDGEPFFPPCWPLPEGGALMCRLPGFTAAAVEWPLPFSLPPPALYTATAVERPLPVPHAPPRPLILPPVLPSSVEELLCGAAIIRM